MLKSLMVLQQSSFALLLIAGGDVNNGTGDSADIVNFDDFFGSLA